MHRSVCAMRWSLIARGEEMGAQATNGLESVGRHVGAS